MAITAWPFENADTTETQYSKLFSLLQETGVISGFAITATTGMNISIAAGSGLVQGFYIESTAAEPRAIAASHATLIRKDYVILKLDLTANTITILVKTGTASAAGTLPALTQTATVWEHPIGVVTIPAAASNIVSGNIEERLAGIGMRVIPYPNVTSRPTPTAKTVGLNTTTKEFEYFNGSTWVNLAPAAPSWSALTGKPTTFAPSAHTHAQSEITGLVDALSGKAPTVHGHTIAQISDIGNASVANSAKVNGIKITSGGSQPTGAATNDLWFP